MWISTHQPFQEVFHVPSKFIASPVQVSRFFLNILEREAKLRAVVGANEPVASLGSFWKLADDEVGPELSPGAQAIRARRSLFCARGSAVFFSTLKLFGCG